MYSKKPDAEILKPLKYLDRDTKTQNTKWQDNTYISIAVRYGLPCNSLCLGGQAEIKLSMIVRFRQWK